MGLRELILAATALLAVYVGYQLYRASRVPKAPASVPPGVSAEGSAGEAPASVELPAGAPAGVDVLAAGDGDDEAGPLYGVAGRLPAASEAGPAPDAFQHELEVRQLRRELEQQGGALAELRRELDELREQLRAHKEQADAGLGTRGASPEYNEALVFARRGLDAEAIAERCGITVAEAELVQSLARSQSGESGSVP
ncbi:DUF2802 domain-containing protein [Aromatoleum petrolei]|uniref:DUF2802 domain-containing protein n=1 Tax=Aromatoleum petrolei TaxID=76116 RepID=A0ABX1MTM6_9RHOO|nr:DUF2802 domain-containing protein [Aromatoleum petrolei]NMF90031.1 DUF2802 domain-containing protein [Aromatoleum petrolei]QTQ36307.1 putative protein DUF2802 [Aromatoleum petrolei]